MRNAYVRVQIGHDGLVVQFNGQTNFKVYYFYLLSPSKDSLTAGSVNYLVGKIERGRTCFLTESASGQNRLFISLTTVVLFDTRLRPFKTV